MPQRFRKHSLGRELVFQGICFNKIHVSFMTRDCVSMPQLNQQHAATRVLVEQAFGIAKMRWAAIDCKELRHTKVEDSVNTILACFILHNLCCQYGDDGEWLAADDPARAARLLTKEAAAPPSAVAGNQEEAPTTVAERHRGRQVRDNLLADKRSAGSSSMAAAEVESGGCCDCDAHPSLAAECGRLVVFNCLCSMHTSWRANNMSCCKVAIDYLNWTN
ncbi:uncharacterized protein LOC122394047 [Amphibalanus amphitrite]|uniref:uncharacterized protein LOC122394047 n=1 Tax=Amphibalanus amphitrite TaxID=1232801 RepID=UPI001C9214B1|nr:uncharacterized protein LOC122394047 [Amphibalanus amphitrite]